MREPENMQTTGAVRAVAEMVSSDQVEAAIGNVLPQEAHESRITNFIQALLLSACLGRLPSLSSFPQHVSQLQCVIALCDSVLHR
jgi:hypothetical protein